MNKSKTINVSDDAVDLFLANIVLADTSGKTQRQIAIEHIAEVMRKQDCSDMQAVKILIDNAESGIASGGAL